MSPLVLLAGLLAAAGTDADSVRGVITDADGKPVAGALVVLFRSEGADDAEREQSTESDAGGRFALGGWRDDGHPWYVLAYKAGLALGGTAVSDPDDRSVFARPRSDQAPHDVKLRLLRPVKLSVRLRDPDGQTPDRSIRVALFHFAPTREEGPGGGRFLIFSAALPRVLAEQFRPQLADDGTLVLDGLPPHTSCGLEIQAPGLGRQRVYYLNPEGAGEQVLQLGRVGSLAGQVVASGPGPVGGLTVAATTSPAARPVKRKGDAPEPLPMQGYATAVTDDQGRFQLRDVAAGQAHLSVQVSNDRGWLPPEQITAAVKAGETAEVRIELTRGTRVRGRVVADGSDQGIEGVVVRAGTERVVSDAKGEFHLYGRPGHLHLSILRVPPSWLEPFQAFRQDEVPAGRQSHELAPIKLKRGVPLQGLVVDEGDRPVAAAHVSAVWQKREAQYSTLGSDAATADANGRFTLGRVPGDVELGLTATTAARGTADLVKVPPEPRQSVRLTVRPEAVVAFEGRVLDQEGKPVAGARVEFHKAVHDPSGNQYGHAAVPFDGGPLMTDAEGAYRTPAPVLRKEQYSVAVEAPGMVKYESGYVTPTREGERFRWADVVLRRELVATGSVVDEKGTPVPGAAVWSHGLQQGTRVTAETDAAGKFRLAQLHPDARLVFAQKNGYRPSGGVIVRNGEVRVTLASQDAPPDAPLKSVRWPRDERQRLLLELLLPILPRLQEEGSGYFVGEALKRLAPYDRAVVQGLLDKLRNDSNRVDVLIALGALDDAQEAAAAVKDPYSRAFHFLAVADAADAPDKKRAILAEALVHARAVERPDRRVVLLGDLAGRFARLSDRAAAQKLLDEGKAVAGQLAPGEWSGFARGHFAEVLAPFDPAAALGLIQDYKDEGSLTRHAGNIAHKLAGVQPAEAERALKLAKNDGQYLSPYAVRVCYRMAAVDLPRARRIADGITSGDPTRTDSSKAQAYGAMAMALAAKDPAAARELLGRAFDLLTADGPDSWYRARTAFPVAAVLLGYSETVDPGRSREYFWRTLTLHAGPHVDSWSPADRAQRTHESASELVLLLALYGQYPELQAELIEPVFRYWSAYTNRKEYDFYRQGAAFVAMALAEPRRAIAWHTAFHAKVDKEDRRLIPQPWMTMADVFAHEGRALHDRITQEVFHLWVIDKEDL